MKRTVLLAMLAACSFSQAQISMTMYGRVGGSTPGGAATWTTVQSPFIDGNAKVGFLGVASVPIGGSAVYYDNTIVFDSPSAGIGSVGEPQIGISNTGGYIVSPSVSGADAAFSNGVTLLKDGDPAPLVPGFFNSFNSRVQMANNGVSSWVAGWSATAGGSTLGRIFYFHNPIGGVFTSPIRGGDPLDGDVVSNNGIQFDYDISPNGARAVNLIQVGALATIRLVKDFSTVVARVGDIAIGGEAWQNWRDPRINNSGDLVTAGDTNGATTTDDFVAVGSTIVLKGSDVVPGYGALTNLTSRSVAVANNGRFVSVWGSGTSPTSTTVLPPSTLANPTVHHAILKKGDQVDVTGDTVADFQVDEIRNILGQAVQLDDNNRVYLAVKLQPIGGGATFDAVVSMSALPPNPTVTGTVDFGQLGFGPYNTGANLPSSLSVSFRDSGNTEIATGSATYNPVTGAFSASVPGSVTGAYRVSFKLGFWLRKTMPNPADPAAAFGDYNFGTVAPLVGDSDDDNEVTNFDYSLWAAANGNSVTANTDNDFDGDGEITNFDYSLWAANNGALGDN